MIPIVPPASRPSRPGPEWLIRALDACLAIGLGLFLGPLLVGRAWMAWRSSGRVFDTAEPGIGDDAGIRRLAFAGAQRGRGWPVLWNIVRGDLAWVGPRRPGASGMRPGLISRRSLGALSGVGYEAEAEDEGRPLGLGERYGILLRYATARLLFTGAGAQAPSSFELLGVRIHNGRMTEALDWMCGRVSAAQVSEVAFVNPHCLNIASYDARYRQVLGQATRVFADGSGIRLAACLRGVRLRDNINGTDLFPRLVARAAAGGLPLYLLGARPGVAEAAAARLQEQYPDLRIAGCRAGYFAEEDESAIVDEINRSGAQILLVALGVPQQELWLARHRQALQVPLRLGVGGLFDFYSGRIPRAPLWLRELGLEWIWRLAQEPRRLWRRYLVGNLVFLWSVLSRPHGSEESLFRLYRDSRPWRMRRVLWARLSQRWWRLKQWSARAAKRMIDLVVSTAALTLLTPLLGLVALLVRLDSPGPIFFSQVRVGRWGREFRMWKFRSMYVDAEERKAALLARNEMAGGVLFKMREDPRVTRVGRWLRKLSIDELPQLWHVLRGDMTLVGPRPSLPQEVASYSPAQRRRLDAKPGITCRWQVSGRSEIPFPQQVELDVAYIEEQSLKLDLQLLWRTLPAVLSGRGAF